MAPLTRPLSEFNRIEQKPLFESDPVKSRAEILKIKVLQLIFRVGIYGIIHKPRGYF